MATRSLNKVMLIGNLTRDPELRYTPAGTPVCTFGVATNRGWTTDTGDRKEETEFHRVVAWAKLAELCSKLLYKGRRVYLEGRLQTRQWTGQDSVTRSTTEVVIDDMLLLDSRKDRGVGDQSGGYGYSQDYSYGQSQEEGTQAPDDQSSISDDSLSSDSSDDQSVSDSAGNDQPQDDNQEPQEDKKAQKTKANKSAGSQNQSKAEAEISDQDAPASSTESEENLKQDDEKQEEESDDIPF